MRKSIVIIGIILLIVGSLFTVMRTFLRPSEAMRENILERLREQFQEMTDEELQQYLEDQMIGGGIFGSRNWRLSNSCGVLFIPKKGHQRF